MRRLTARARQPRADKERAGEKGAVSIMMAFLMVGLLGFTALVVDVGFLYAERGQLQNGADAAALGVAQKCAREPSSADCSTTSPLAKELGDKNALDGLTNIKSIELDKTSGKVTVTTGAQEDGGEANKVSLFFANILGNSSAEVGARASAVWGSASAGTTPFPLAMSVCQVEGRVDGAMQRLQSHGTGANSSCNYGPSGQTVAGGFGWLAQDPGICGGKVNIYESEGGSSPGNSEPPYCSEVLNRWAADITAGRDVVILLPVFNQVTGTGSSASYGLTSFAAFKVKGWKFSGGSDLPSVFQNTSTHVGTLACTGECRGIIGTFVGYVSLQSGYTLGGPDKYSAKIVRMTD
jgi:Flp pilus assembly protein TadG